MCSLLPRIQCLLCSGEFTAGKGSTTQVSASVGRGCNSFPPSRSLPTSSSHSKHPKLTIRKGSPSRSRQAWLPNLPSCSTQESLSELQIAHQTPQLFENQMESPFHTLFVDTVRAALKCWSRPQAYAGAQLPPWRSFRAAAAGYSNYEIHYLVVVQRCLQTLHRNQPQQKFFTSPFSSIWLIPTPSLSNLRLSDYTALA